MSFYVVIWHKINTNPVCFGARDDTFGSFNITQPGHIGALRLVHIYGLLVCHSISTNSFWGCEVPLYVDKTLMTLISHSSSRSVLLPRRKLTQMGLFDPNTCGIELTYRLDGFNDSSPELIFNTSSVPLAVSSNQEFWIWCGQDLADCSESNNYGQSCVDVYEWYIWLSKKGLWHDTYTAKHTVLIINGILKCTSAEVNCFN